MSLLKTTIDVNIRKKPSADAPIATKALAAATVVSFLSEDSGWSNVKLDNGIEGWIKSKYLVPAVVASGTPKIVDKIISVAKSQLGLAEIPKGSNWGKHVQKYLNAVGIDFPSAWCMSFVYWVVNEACKALQIANPLVRTGGVLDMWVRVDKRFKIVWRPVSPSSGIKDWHRWDVATQSYVRTQIQPGDIAILNFGEGKGHTYFVEKVAGDRAFTLEGNSNDEGSREGYEVCRKPNGRSINGAKGYIRLS